MSKAITQCKGYLSRADQIEILEELQTESHSGMRLKLLRSIMLGSIPNSIIQKLEDQGSFNPILLSFVFHDFLTTLPILLYIAFIPTLWYFPFLVLSQELSPL